MADITNLEEEPGQVIINDGCDGCSYLVGSAPELTFSGTVCGTYDCGVRTVADPATDC